MCIRDSICSIIKGKGVSLLPLITPFNLDVDKRNPFNLIVSFQARSNQVDSSIVRVQIAWDGMWDEGDQKHLVVKILK